MSVIASGVVLHDRFSPPGGSAAEAVGAREATRGLDGNGKISKDMRMTAMPRIDARWSCVD
jgi:hypothetical protein